MPLAAAPKSSTASFAAATEPAPPMSEYRLDMSLITPILTTPSVYCANAGLLAKSAAITIMLRVIFILVLHAGLAALFVSILKGCLPKDISFWSHARACRGLDVG